MTTLEQQLLCIKCKTELIVKSLYNDEKEVYKLVVCPNCKTPIRDIRCNEKMYIKKV